MNRTCTYIGMAGFVTIVERIVVHVHSIEFICGLERVRHILGTSLTFFANLDVLRPQAWIQLSSPLQSDEYLDRQPHLNNDMRHILFDWIVEVRCSLCNTGVV